MSTFQYVVNDIDETMREIETGAASTGYYCTHIDCPITEPSLFPPHKEQMLAAVKKALERECSKNCHLCFFPHPMLSVGEHDHYKMCTLIVTGIFPSVRRYVKMIGLTPDHL